MDAHPEIIYAAPSHPVLPPDGAFAGLLDPNPPTPKTMHNVRLDPRFLMPVLNQPTVSGPAKALATSQ
jgi:hypothetical protein